MYSTCPKCQHEIQSEDVAALTACPACGLVFEKYLQRLVSEESIAVSGRAQRRKRGLLATVRTVLLPERTPRRRVELIGYALIWAGLAYFGMHFIAMDFHSNEIGRSFMHNINLVFHEAGHILFMPFGRTPMIFGGSLFQVLLPLALMFAFLIVNRDAFGAAVCLWWAGQSLMDLAPYIADASVLRLPLLGGGTGADSPGMHDWENLLRPRGLLPYDEQIASAVDNVGAAIVLLALCWGAFALLREWRQPAVSELSDEARDSTLGE